MWRIEKNMGMDKRKRLGRSIDDLLSTEDEAVAPSTLGPVGDPTCEVIAVSLKKTVLERLDAEAEKSYLSRNAMIELALSRYFSAVR